MTPTMRRSLAVLSGVALVALIVFALCGPRPTQLSRDVVRTLDSLDATNPAFHARIDTLIRVETTFVQQSATHAHQAVRAVQSADSIHARVIAAQRVAEAERDTSSHWHDVAVLQSIEIDSLRSANAAIDSALVEQIAARTAADARASADSSRLAAVERFNTRLIADLSRADPPCRVLWVARCPSRKLSLVSGALIGGVGVLLERRISQR